MIASATGELTLWRYGTDVEPSVLEGLREVLSVEENARALCFRFERDRRRFQARRSALRHILASSLGCAPQDITYDLTASGRPVLRRSIHGDALAFSASHRDGLMLLAVTEGSDVGVDVEARRTVTDLPNLANRVFTAAELERGLGTTSLSFLRHWTRKEAILKAIGTGLLVDPSQVDLRPLSSSSHSEWIWAARPHLVIRDLVLPLAHVGAVCAESSVRCIRHLEWTPPQPNGPHAITLLRASPA